MLAFNQQRFLCLFAGAISVLAISIPQQTRQQLQYDSENSSDWTWVPTPTNASLSLYGFSWSSCGSASDIATLNHLSVVPDPIALPGNVTGYADGSLSKDLVAPLKTSLKLYKKALVWVEIPCVSGLGSCTYDDVCQLLDKVTIPDCPIASCKCPFPAGYYNVSQGLTVSVSVPSSIPSWAANGEYKVDVTVQDSASEQVTCLELIINLKFNSKHEEQDLEAESNNLESCDPNDFSYTVCNLTSPVCPTGQYCKHLKCPFPGQCYLPQNCTCDSKTHEMNCTNDPTHKTECNSEYCGVCQDKTQKEFVFRQTTLAVQERSKDEDEAVASRA